MNQARARRERDPALSQRLSMSRSRRIVDYLVQDLTRRKLKNRLEALRGRSAPEGLIEVREQVLQVFDPHADPDQVVVDAEFPAGFGRDARMGHDRRMLDQ